MSVDGRLIADVRRLHQLNGASLFLLVAGGKGVGKSTALTAFADGLAAACAVEEINTTARLLQRPASGEAAAEAFTVCRLTFVMLAEITFQASGSLTSAQQLRPFTVLVADDVDVLWMLCSANNILGQL
ncbi:putative ATPase domain protein [Leptomonas seymouri]|uniref:Putative ATPase domain protein n=1 Tax=Leptomonas seymouri TaxID=5684 RepID=A0A0N0P3N7_LEPSE|nr:putative ATPase domain protein [Leptomonas seymouri]|eukprot:KPI84339.1 putative ATPase domain protein [Leptomonas seymouri]